MQVKRYLYYFILLMVLFLGTLCGSKKEKPAGVLTHSEMVNTLIDLYIAEQKIVKMGLSRDSAQVVFKKLRTKVFEPNHVSDSILLESFDFYQAHPKELEEIYSALVDSLNLLEQQANTQSPVQ